MGGDRHGVPLVAAESLTRFVASVGDSRKVEAELLRRLSEVDAEQHNLHASCSSMYEYMTSRLGYAEGAAYKRIRVARLGRQFPRVLEEFQSGRVHLSGLHVMAPELSPDNVDDWLDRAAAKRTRHNPNRVKREAYDRDGGLCTFTDAEGHRCNQDVVELHHKDPFAIGGEHSADFITTYCPRHNSLAAELDFGWEKMRRFRGS